MTDPMSAEFDTVAEWTAEAARALGPEHYIPAGCRGSGSPAALEWLIDGLELADGATLLDCGAGVGGPAAYAAHRRSVRPVLVEPEAGACRAARTLFGYPVVQGSADALPIADASVDAGWSLGVMCTMTAQLELLTELRRVVRPGGRIGLLVFVATSSDPDGQPEGNKFPTVASLKQLISDASLRIDSWSGTAELPSAPDEWQQRVQAVEDLLAQRHGHEEVWQVAEEQSARMGRLLRDQEVTGELLVLSRR
ncbi:class I SAM-dependent methyltransferase [Mycobacterium sp. MYCO198283]|uniref:class I SAM-dependent methyltransferase n=1 Tax=Mycobacterium sp. MYCO198283 TaxID=2883505 RepID=UPI001E53B33E|nr:class I SAM-dependent methyltransferase [Mycobacterium sp. MYCO198283]MCG5431267.1 class I SAM-dependent methyltransferase [Mycobacterium sp. MYCO198283]